ncbi:MAG: hypothetical protein ABWY54_01430 [Glaciihabitans sp.]
MNRFVWWPAAASVMVLALCGCAADTTPPTTSTAPVTSSVAEAATRTECENTALTLTVIPAKPTAGQQVEVSTAPEQCLVTGVWTGEIIVRIEGADAGTNSDTRTGTRIEAGTSQPVTVEIPSGIEGTGYIMLQPDEDCDDFGDCYYPYAEITINAPVR